MRSFRISSRRAGRIATTAALLVATIVPSFAPALASAASVTDRSVALTTSVKDAAAVSYEIKFTTTTADTGAFVVDFCTVSPLIGDPCATPADFSVSAATTATAGWTRTVVDANTIRLVSGSQLAADTDVTVVLDNVHNPSALGTFYARIVTYDNATNATAYVSTAQPGTGYRDQGAVAIAITDNIAVSGAVLEALTFCVSGAAIVNADCTGTTAPVLTLGDDVGNGVIALNPNDLSEGNVYTKISTNAIGGAVVSLKSTAACGGLALYGTGDCNIAPAGNSGTFGANEAKFGVKLTLPGDNGTNGTIAVAGAYHETDYRFNYTGPSTGVTSTYGDPIFTTSAAPANNKDTMLTFAASSTNATPAGRYSTDISLIATGTF